MENLNQITNQDATIAKITFLFTVLFMSQLAAQAQNVYHESFNLSDGTTNDTGNSAWSRTSPALDANDAFDVRNQYFYAKDIDGEGVWTSQVMNIAGISGGVDISIDIVEVGTMQNDDYIRLYYKVNGGSEQLIANRTGQFSNDWFPTFQTESVSGVSGNTLQIVIRVNNDQDSQEHAFDNIIVKYTNGGGSLYSRGSGDWDLGTRWSKTGYSGSSCGCFPNEATNVNIGNSRSINLTTTGYVNNLTVDNTGSLVDGSTTNAPLIFQGSSGTTQLVVNGLVNIEDIYHNGSNTIQISGSGNLTANNIVLGTANGKIINSSTGTITLNQALNYNNISNAAFTNNGNVTVNNIVFNTFLFWGHNNSLVNNGVLTVTNDLTVSASGASGHVMTNNAGATLNLGGALSLTNGDLTINNSGTINQSGNFTGIDGGSSFNNLNGSVWNWSHTGAAYDTDVNTILNCNNGTNTFSYSASGNQAIIPVTYSNLTFSGSGDRSTQANLEVNGNLTLNGSTNLNMNGSGDTLFLAGNWVNNGGTFTEGSATEAVVLDGSGSQSISNASGETFRHLVLKKTTGSASLIHSITVNGTFRLTSGHLFLNNRNLTITNAGSIAGGSTTTFVVTNGNGQLVQNGLGIGQRNGNVVFPVGVNTSSYTPLTINNGAGIADNFGVKICDGIYTNGSCGGGTAVTENVVNRSWFIEESVVGGSNANLTFQWNAVNEMTEFDRTELMVVHHNGSEWEVIEASAASGSGSYTTTATNVNSFSPFGIEGSGPSLLPIELLSFHAELETNEVIIDWKTSTEINNNFFTIEKTVDFKKYEEVAVVSGKGTSYQVNAYQTLDTHPYAGVSYYRLKQTDFDGKFTYSDFVQVNNAASLLEVSLYPVPNPGDQLHLTVSGLTDNSDLLIKVLDVTGNVVFAHQVTSLYSESIQLNFSDKLVPGVYTLQAGSQDELMMKKFMVR